MKMELIGALLHEPKILFPDEPTIGLDAVAQKQIRGFLKEVNRGIILKIRAEKLQKLRELTKTW